MWQRFSEMARKVVFNAQEEAQKLGDGYVSTEHLLLGLVRESYSVAARVLEKLGVSLNRIRIEVEKQLPRGTPNSREDMTLTPRGKRVIDLAWDEAKNLNNQHIGTEHLLLGLIRESEGLAGRVLAKLGVELERARIEVMVQQDSGTVDRMSGEVSALMARYSKYAPLIYDPSTLPSELMIGGGGEANTWARCTVMAREAVSCAQEEARNNGKAQVDNEHLLWGLQKNDRCIAFWIIVRFGVNPERIRVELEKYLAGGYPRSSNDMTLSLGTKRALDFADEERRNLFEEHIGTDHLLLGLLRENDNIASQVLNEFGITLEYARREAVGYRNLIFERELQADEAFSYALVNSPRTILAAIRSKSFR